MSSSLESLVCSLVPPARRDDALKDELVAHCHEILNSVAYCAKRRSCTEVCEPAVKTPGTTRSLKETCVLVISAFIGCISNKRSSTDGTSIANSTLSVTAAIKTPLYRSYS
ncbi:hypothetical protein EW026_g171 [Hermanssonia centrifuga]|uniref:Uncharacterized protein n=1 Tax=Hermanssonia centrifuga TaxID=98765 RepID=A0A4S4KW09_9APHY|nr:hypothetical protein EW026_g171 [Hermanssonia centrifuga]